jgi:hypothetical protein
MAAGICSVGIVIHIWTWNESKNANSFAEENPILEFRRQDTDRGNPALRASVSFQSAEEMSKTHSEPQFEPQFEEV